MTDNVSVYFSTLLINFVPTFVTKLGYDDVLKGCTGEVIELGRVIELGQVIESSWCNTTIYNGVTSCVSTNEEAGNKQVME